jgi:hypothetical protein
MKPLPSPHAPPCHSLSLSPLLVDMRVHLYPVPFVLPASHLPLTPDVGPYEIRDNENADGITELDNKNGIN